VTSKQLSEVNDALLPYQLVAGVCAFSLLAADLARLWQGTYQRYPEALEFLQQPLVLYLLSIGFVGYWIFYLRHWLRYLEWPQWFAPIYVGLVLCPSAWILAQKARSGLDLYALFILQLPVIICTLRRSRMLARRSKRTNVN